MSYSSVLENLDARGLFHIKPGLGRMRRMSRALSHPERQWAALHIAGTNGKGSVSATLESILRTAGYKTGLYTSPHLVRLSERIRVNGRPISDAQFTRYGNRLIAAEKSLRLRLTYFEFLTALAFLCFAEEKIDVGIIECGMGGRWDATNVIPRPLVSVITSIGLDHTAWLGNSLSLIAHEKAGIIKKDGLTVSGVDANVQDIMAAEARKQNNRFFSLNHDFRGIPLHADWKKPLQSWSYETLPSTAKARGNTTVETPLMGRHQVDNGAISMNVVEQLRGEGWAISEAAIREGFKRVQWPGRLQVFQHPGKPLVLIDGAHNPHAMAKLLTTLKGPEFRNRRLSFVFSAFSDKDVATMAAQLGPVATRIYLCEMAGSRRSTLAELSTAFARFREKVVLCSGGVDEALAHAWRDARSSDCIVATGSLMLVGDLLKKKRVFNG